MDSLPPLGAAFYMANRETANADATSSRSGTPHGLQQRASSRQSQRPPSTQQNTATRTRSRSRRNNGLEIRFYRHRADAQVQNERMRKELERERRAANVERKEEHERLRNLQAVQAERERIVVGERGEGETTGPGRSSRFSNPDPVYAEEQVPQSSRMPVVEKTRHATVGQRQRLQVVKDHIPPVTQPAHKPRQSSRAFQRPVAKHVRIAEINKIRQQETAAHNRVPPVADPASEKEVVMEAHREEGHTATAQNDITARAQSQTKNTGTSQNPSWPHDYYVRQDPYREEELEWEAREQMAMASMSSVAARGEGQSDSAVLSPSVRGVEGENTVSEQMEQMAFVEQEMRSMQLNSTTEQQRIFESVRRAGRVFSGHQAAEYDSIFQRTRKDEALDKTNESSADTITDKDKPNDTAIDELEERFGPRLADDVIDRLWEDDEDPPPPYEALRHDDRSDSGYTPSKSAYMDDAFR